MTANDTEITNKQEMSDEMNEYFSSIGSNLAEGIPRELMIFKPPRGHSGPRW